MESHVDCNGLPEEYDTNNFSDFREYGVQAVICHKNTSHGHLLCQFAKSLSTSRISL
jgi:hypothetical protein